MALITIFSASVSVHAMSGGTAVFVDWEIVNTILNLQQNSQNCTIVKYNTSRPTPSMTDSTGAIKTQKTTYNVLLDLYETVTVEGASWADNVATFGRFEWYKYGNYCWIRYIPDTDTNICWVANYQGKILYCDAPVEEPTYTVSAIAGASTYFITPRPVGTVGNGYLGDLYIPRTNYNNIKSALNNLGSSTSYYTILFSVNGETRYYLATIIGSTRYYVCNSGGQLFYTLKEDPPVDDDTGGGSTFDPTEVITAINSVYSAINSMNSNLATRITNLRASVDAFSTQFGMHMDNTVFGFESIGNQLTTLNGYFSDLSGLFPVQEEITLLGSDTRVAWDSADRITGVKTSGFDSGDLTVKTNPGPLIDESGYQNVKLSPDTTEYTLSTFDGYRRITADNEYPPAAPSYPENTLLYFPFDNSLGSSVGDYTLSYGGTPLYSSGVAGDAFVFDGSHYLYANNILNSVSVKNYRFTFSFWLYLTSYSDDSFTYMFKPSSNHDITCYVRSGGTQFTISNGYTSGVVNGAKLSLNTWNNLAMTYDGNYMYFFINGTLQGSSYLAAALTLGGDMTFGRWGSDIVPHSSMIDEMIFVNGSCLWTSSFNAQEEAIFSSVAADYFLPCTDQTIGLVFDDTINQTLTPTDVNGNAITMGRLEDDFSEIYMDTTTMMWYCHDPQTQTEILLSSANQQIMNDTIYVRQNYSMIPADQITADALQNLLPVDSPVYLDMPEGAKITITYDHYSGWFRAMYILMDKQNQLLNDLDIVNETIINVENTVVNISPDKDAYYIFYITKTDGTTESVGDAAKDAAVFIGDVLSMFYRLVFEDALDNVDILNDFESVFSDMNSGV